jgi:hypothetical protein
MLEGVLISISTDILPNVVNPKAAASAQMMQSIIQGIRQMLPVYDQYLAEEHNQMMEVLRDVASAIGESSGAAADRIREHMGPRIMRDVQTFLVGDALLGRG